VSDHNHITRHVSLADLAHLLGVARTTALGWTKQGCPYVQKADRDEGVAWVFDISEVIRWREERAAREGFTGTPADYTEAQTRKMAAEAEMAEIKLAKERGDAVSITDTEKAWSNIIVNFRAKMLALPQRAAPLLVGQSKERVIANMLRDEIYSALDELSRMDPGEIWPNDL
jgi:phage terminase Nu1 subunit (DNA packaging protein)